LPKKCEFCFAHVQIRECLNVCDQPIALITNES